MRVNAMALVVIGLALGAARADDSVADQLRRAFPGEDGPLLAPIKIVAKDQGVIVAGHYWKGPTDSGQVRLTGCFVYRSPAGSGPTARPVAIRARSVVLTYDAPVREVGDLRGRKLVWVSADLDDGVRLEFTRR